MLDHESLRCRVPARAMPFAFSTGLRADWHRRAARNNLIEGRYGLSHDEVLTAARSETVVCYTDNCFDNVPTHIAYNPDSDRPHNSANCGGVFGPPIADFASRRRPRRREPGAFSRRRGGGARDSTSDLQRDHRVETSRNSGRGRGRRGRLSIFALQVAQHMRAGARCSGDTFR